MPNNGSPGGVGGEGAAATGNVSQRWRHLILGVICMVMIANLQYGWALFVLPLHNKHGWAVTDIQFAFSMFIALETWATPIDGWIADALGPKWGPRTVMGVGGLLVAVGWIIEGSSSSLSLLYFGGAITGLGAGAVYATAVGNATKWFKDRRGLATGLTAAGFGAGAALTIIPIRMVLASVGVSSAFIWFGIIQGAIIMIASQFIRAPYAGEAPAVTQVKVHQTSRSHTPGQMLQTPVFWVLYVLFVLMAGGGLMAAANLAVIAKSYGIANGPLFLGATTLSVALIFANICNGIARPLFGWIADNIGHSNTMAIAFGLGAVAYFLMTVVGAFAWGFVLMAGVIFLCWGEIFSLFPAMCTDLFGPKYATVNLSFLYTSKGLAGFIVPIAAAVAASTHNWSSVLYVTTVINVIAVIIVLLVLRPVEARYHREEDALSGSGQPAE
jgi:OFA family oxalate/formate antiporter-like MFS transporter